MKKPKNILKHSDYLNLMGIDVWEKRTSVSREQASSIPIITKKLNIDDVINKSGSACPICIEKNVVHLQTMINGKKWYWLVSTFDCQESFSLQNPNAKLLQAMVSAVKGGNITQNDLRFMNCSEVRNQNCAKWLAHQIRQHSPDVLIVMGLSLARLLLLSKDIGQDAAMETLPVNMIDGEYELLKLPLIATYHPAEILADLSLKRQVWKDLKRALAHIMN